MSTDNSNLKLPGTSTAGHPQAQPFWLPGGNDGVLLIHGYGGSAGDFHEFAKSFVDQGQSVLVMRVAGHGQDPAALARTSWVDWQRSVDEAATWLSQHCKKFMVVGISFGGILGLDYAVRHPEHVAGVVTINTPMQYRFSPLKRLGIRLLGLVTPYYRKPGNSPADRARMAAIGSLAAWPIAGLLEFRAKAQQEVLPALRKLQAPLLMFRSVDDPLIDPKSAEMIAAQLQVRHEIVTLDDPTHRPYRDENFRREIVAKIGEFFHSPLST